MGKIISVTNQKGGVGKTTSAVNLAAALGNKGKKTLLIDMDPQGNATSGLGINKKNVTSTSYDMLVGGMAAQKAVIKTEFKDLYLIPSSIDLASAEIELIEKENRIRGLRALLLPLKDEFDYVIIDCPPSLGLITINALTASDSILIPIQCEFFALEGLAQLVSTVRTVKAKYNTSLEVEGVLLTMYDSRLNLTVQVADEVKKHFPGKVFSTVIPRSVRISEAPSYGKPVQYYDNSCKGAYSYNCLADQIIKNNK